MAIPNDLVEMGYIAAPFGIQGWVKIKVTTESVDSLDGYKVIYLKDQQGIISEQKIEKSFAKDSVLNAKLANTSDRDAAFALRGSVVCVSRGDFPKPEADEFYWIDLIGLNVINSQNESFGVVKTLMETGASDVLVVSDGEVERLIPFVAQFILNISLEKKQITVDWGLDY